MRTCHSKVIPFIVPQASVTLEVVYGYKSPYFTADTRVVQVLQPATPYNPMFSELTIVKLKQPLKCGAAFPVTVKYSFVGETGEHNTDIIYMVSGQWFSSHLCCFVCCAGLFVCHLLCTISVLSGHVQRSDCLPWISKG